MSEYVHKSHNVSVLMYHVVCPAKYRRAIFSEAVRKTLVETCKEISERYEIYFLEIGTEADHVHFLVQSVPKYSPTKIVTIVKSITAKRIFIENPEVKKQLWGGELWTDGYFVSTVSRHGNEETIAKYVKNQGQEKEYQQLHKAQEYGQLAMF